MGWRELSENVLLLSGSPNTVVFISNAVALAVDPGYGDGRAKNIHRKLDALGARRFALLTHGHVDHIAECRGFERVFAHRWEVGLAENATLRNVAEFGVTTTKGFHFITGDSVQVTDELWWGDEILGANAVDTHGHTPGHTAFRYGNAISVGDAVFGDRLIERVKIPFHTDVFDAIETLKRLEKELGENTILIPGHGPIVEGEDAKELIRKNIEAIEKMIKDLWTIIENGGTIEEITIRLMEYYGLKITPEFVLLDKTSIRSILSKWVEDGKVKVSVKSKGIIWSKNK